MPQPIVFFDPEQVYHIWTHANGKENLFRVEENYRYFLRRYAHYIHPLVDTYAYCLMPNHLHLMIRIKSEAEVLTALRKGKATLKGFETLGGFSKSISLQFSHLFNAYTQAYNKMHKRKGSLFIPNFKRKLIDSDSYFSALVIYIHQNPVTHGFVKKLSDWTYSSYTSYLSQGHSLLQRKEVLGWFGSLDGFQKDHGSTVPKEILMQIEH
jgi:putative transposase